MKLMIRQFLMRAERGNIAIMFAMVLPLLLSGVGLAVDFAVFSMKQTTLQSAADMAALAGAKELGLATSNDSGIKTATAAFIDDALKSKGLVVASASAIDRKKNSVSVQVTEQWVPFFAQYIGADITPIVVKATASLSGSANICVLTLNPDSNKSLHMDKSSKLTAKDCGVYSDSLHSIGLTVDQSAILKASLVCSAGGVKQKGTISPTPITDCPVIADPLASRPAPSFSGCSYNNVVISSGAMTLHPGVYCGGLKVTGTANITLESGNYIIKDGPLEVSHNAKFVGDHVGFYLAGNAAILNLTGSSTISLTGSTTGEMAGLLFFEDRNAPVGRQHHINSSNAQKLTGTIYLPQGYLLVDPNSVVANQSAYTAIISNRLELSEGPELVLNSDYGASDVPVPDGIRASQSVVLIN
jgi:Flp pilus assembly protein TadG